MTSHHLIVYAEDDLDDLQFVKEAFEQHDHIEILHATDGYKALNILNELKEKQCLPCLVILDINMPMLDGRQTLELIKKDETLKNVPVVLFSTSSGLSDHDFAKKHGSELITKPLNIHDLEHIAKLFIDKCNFELNKLKTVNKVG